MKQKFQEFWSIIYKLRYVLTGSQRKGAVGIFFVIILSAVMELCGVSMLYPFLQMMVNPDALREKWYLKGILTLVPNLSNVVLLCVLALAFILVYIIKNMALMFSTKLQLSYAAAFRRDCGTRLLDSYMRRPYEYFVNTNSSVILRGIGWDVASVYAILLGLFNLITDLLTVLLLAVYLIITDYVIAIGALLLATVCLITVTFGMRKRVKRAGEESREKAAEVNMRSYQTITGAKEITVMGRKDFFVDKYRASAIDYEALVKDYSYISALPARIIEMVCISGIMGLVCVRIIVGVDMDTFIPTLGTFAMCAFKILPSMSTISGRINTLLYNRPGLEYTYDNLREVENIDAMMAERESKVKEQVGGDASFQHLAFKEQILLKDISWHYLNVQTNVLDRLNVEINKGESVAFVGPSGAGKTTLADIILGLLQPQNGSVTMDGIDIFSIPKQWCHIIGYVPQTVFLLDDTVRANIAFGLPEEMVTDERIWDALEQAQLKSFVEGLPQGLDTMVGERGVKFSGGQRQRIAIARALYENPDILVLDEATSALDTETETAVMEAIDALQGVKTLIIVAHRLSTIRNCDKIYEIRDGVATLKEREDVLKEVR